MSIIELCPTCVGMNRAAKDGTRLCSSLPHMRGDEPKNRRQVPKPSTSAPHAWG